MSSNSPIVRSYSDGCLEVVVHSVEDTHKVAKALFSELGSKFALGLTGPLGVGKTEFARGILLAAGLKPSEITSPTFVLENEYQLASSNRRILHWDLYRLAEETEAPLDLLEAFSLGNVGLIVEWPERTPEILNLLSLEIVLGFAPILGAVMERKICFKAKNPKWQKCLKAFADCLI